ncbi:MAG: hypothetical protein C5B59_17440 [Bacteroidetes bacterium]|nr:MAG: hypothetical protein C5B59_17440 [Bacteroidota bacterium]
MPSIGQLVEAECEVLFHGSQSFKGKAGFPQTSIDKRPGLIASACWRMVRRGFMRQHKNRFVTTKKGLERLHRLVYAWKRR